MVSVCRLHCSPFGVFGPQLLLLLLLLLHTLQDKVGAHGYSDESVNRGPQSDLDVRFGVPNDRSGDDEMVFLQTTQDEGYDGVNTDDFQKHTARLLASSQADDERNLIEQCPPDLDLNDDAVWYTIEVDIFSLHGLKCSENQWKEMRAFLETELDKIDLFEDFKIYDLNAKLCSEPESSPQRRKLVFQNNTDPSASEIVVDEDDERFQQYLDTGNDGHRDLRFIVIWYDLFYKGGSRYVLSNDVSLQGGAT